MTAMFHLHFQITKPTVRIKMSIQSLERIESNESLVRTPRRESLNPLGSALLLRTPLQPINVAFPEYLFFISYSSFFLFLDIYDFFLILLTLSYHIHIFCEYMDMIIAFFFVHFRRSKLIWIYLWHSQILLWIFSCSNENHGTTQVFGSMYV